MALASPEPSRRVALFTVKEYALRVRMHEKSVYRLIARGKIQVIRVGGSIRVLPPRNPYASHPSTT